MRGPGRPRAATPLLISEAAGELCFEVGWSRVTATDIALRSGVSRPTFFRYFADKDDVLWALVDDFLDGLPRALARREPNRARRTQPVSDHGAYRRIVTRLFEHADGVLGQGEGLWAMTYGDLAGTTEAIVAGRSKRESRLADALTARFAELTGRQIASFTDDPVSDLAVHLRLRALAGRVFTVLYAWSRAGVQRGALDEWLWSAERGVEATARRP